MSIAETVRRVHETLRSAGIDHAFGGAIALGYVVDPRGTIDVDVNVFVPASDIARVLEPLGAVGYTAEEVDDVVPIAGLRVRRPDDVVPVDLFPSLDDSYDAVRQRARSVPFGDGVRIPVLSAEDLAAFKLSFGRDKDWVDLARIAEARPDLDIAVIEDFLITVRGPSMYPRVARLRAMLEG